MVVVVSVVGSRLSVDRVLMAPRGDGVSGSSKMLAASLTAFVRSNFLNERGEPRFIESLFLKLN